MTTLTTGRHSTSTIAWRFTTCTSTNSSTERAHVVLFLAHLITLTLAQVRALSALSLHHHGHPRERSLFTLIHSTLHFPAFLLSFFLFPFFHSATSTALIFQEQSPISELFKDTQDVVSLILYYRTMWKFKADFSNIFTTRMCV